jgi:DNA polymerase III alpha subunit
MASVLNNGGGFYSPAVYIEESKRLGLKIELPSINESEKEYAGKGKTICIGLKAIKNLSYSAIENIVEERKRNGKYVSLADFLVRTKLAYEKTALLIRCGAMGCFRQTRPTLLRLLDIYIHRRKIIEESYNDLFLRETFALEEEVKTDMNYTLAGICKEEYETFGYMVTRHPLYFFKDWIEQKGVMQAKDMQRNKGRRVKMIGWYMTSKRIKTKKGEIMKFLSLEDLTGTFEAVIFPKVYYRVAELTLSMGPYLVTGRVDVNDHTNLVVEDMKVLSSTALQSSLQKDSVEHNYYGDEEKITEEDFALAKALDHKKLKVAYAG